MNKCTRPLRLVIPTGRLREPVLNLLADAGIRIQAGDKQYRPAVSDNRLEVKLLKAANVPKLVEFGAHDLGFCGRDWVEETGADVATLLNTGLMPVRVVSAAPAGRDPFSDAKQPVIVASEYENLTRRYMNARGRAYHYVRTHGATEVFPPEDADLIVDNVATGRTLQANGLAVLDELLSSSTLLVANFAALEDPALRVVIGELEILIGSVLAARTRVLLDMNVTADRLDEVVRLLPAMRSPTVQPLHAMTGYAVRAAVRRDDVGRLLPALKNAGATDILQSQIERVLL